MGHKDGSVAARYSHNSPADYQKIREVAGALVESVLR